MNPEIISSKFFNRYSTTRLWDCCPIVSYSYDILLYKIYFGPFCGLEIIGDSYVEISFKDLCTWFVGIKIEFGL